MNGAAELRMAAPVGETRGRALFRYAAFIALTDYALALALPFLFTSVVVIADPQPAEEALRGFGTMLAFGAIMGTVMLPVFLLVCAPVWFLARRAARRRGFGERAGAMLAALPCAAAATAAMAVFLSGSSFGGEFDAAAAALYGIPLVASLVAAPLAARLVYRNA